MNYALFVEYEGILLGNTQKFSQLSLTRLREKTMLAHQSAYRCCRLHALYNSALHFWLYHDSHN